MSIAFFSLFIHNAGLDPTVLNIDLFLLCLADYDVIMHGYSLSLILTFDPPPFRRRLSSTLS